MQARMEIAAYFCKAERQPPSSALAMPEEKKKSKKATRPEVHFYRYPSGGLVGLALRAHVFPDYKAVAQLFSFRF